MFYQDQQPYTPMSDPYSTTTKQNKLPSILDMCYLSGKIYEDPEKDKSLEKCSLIAEGAEVFNRCSHLNASWRQNYREYANDKIRLAVNGFLSAPKWLAHNAGLSNLNVASAQMKFQSPEIKQTHSSLKDSARNSIKQDERHMKDLRKIHKAATGFKAALYLNERDKCSVIAIRGTEPSDFMTVMTDIDYVRCVVPHMYKQAALFFKKVEGSPITKEYPIVACTEHSLGGIIAKMIAPVTGLSTYTFNSPGVRQFLDANVALAKTSLEFRKVRNRAIATLPVLNPEKFLDLDTCNFLLQEDGSARRLKVGQEILTFIANGDVIGNLNSDHDIGKHIHIPVLNSARIGYTRIKQYFFSEDAHDYVRKNFLTYHGIVELFNHLKIVGTPEKHENRSISYAS